MQRTVLTIIKQTVYYHEQANTTASISTVHNMKNLQTVKISLQYGEKMQLTSTHSVTLDRAICLIAT